MSGFEKVMVKFLKCFALITVVFFLAGLGIIFYCDHHYTHVPVWRSSVKEFVLQTPVPDKKTAALLSQEVQKIVDLFEIKDVECFVFKGHVNRPVYDIFMAGRICTKKDLSAYTSEKRPLKEQKRLFAALELCGAAPEKEDHYTELEGIFFYRVYIYKEHIIFHTCAGERTLLSNDARKQAFLEKFIVPKASAVAVKQGAAQ